jgi:hypothetical protein
MSERGTREVGSPPLRSPQEGVRGPCGPWGLRGSWAGPAAAFAVGCAVTFCAALWWNRHTDGQIAASAPGGSATSGDFYTWEPLRTIYRPGESISILRIPHGEGDHATGHTRYRLQLKKLPHGDWAPIGGFSDQLPSITFVEEGVFSLHLDERGPAGVAGLWLGNFDVADVRSDPGGLGGFVWVPYRAVFSVGDVITIHRPDAQRSDDGAEYRLQVMSSADGGWVVVEDFAPHLPQLTFSEPGIVNLHIDERVDGLVRGRYLGQVFVSPRSLRSHHSRLLRSAIARHYDPMVIRRRPAAGWRSDIEGRVPAGTYTDFEFSDIPGLGSGTVEHDLHAAVAQECLLMLLLMYWQYHDLEREQLPALFEELAFAGMEPLEAGDDVLIVHADRIGTVRIDLATHLALHDYGVETWHIEGFPEMAGVFEVMRGHSLPATLAAAVTCALHGHFVFGQRGEVSAWGDGGGLGYPTLVGNFGHCGTYQTALHDLLVAAGFRTRSVAVRYLGGAVHTFNEILVDGENGPVVYTMDASASVCFAGSVCDPGQPEFLRLPSAVILHDVFWGDEFGTSIRAHRVECGNVLRAHDWPQDLPFTCEEAAGRDG